MYLMEWNVYYEYKIDDFNYTQMVSIEKGDCYEQACVVHIE